MARVTVPGGLDGSSMCRTKSMMAMGCCIIFVGFILIMVLVPLTFSYVEYDEYGLKRHRIDKSVDTNNVYDMGRYSLGPSYDTITFPRLYQKLDGTYAIFSTSGVEIDIGVSFLYRLKRDEVGQFYDEYGMAFKSQVQDRANAKIKNVAPQYTIDQYTTNREEITQALWESLSEDLKEVHMEVPQDKFLLGRVTIPDEVLDQDLAAAVQRQRNIEEGFKQQSTLVRKETERLVEEIGAEIDLIGLTAQAEAGRVLAEAHAFAERVDLTAEGLGLQLLFNRTGVTSQAVKDKYMAYFAFLDSQADDKTSS